MFETREPENPRHPLLVAADHGLAVMVRAERKLDDSPLNLVGEASLELNCIPLVAERVRQIGYSAVRNGLRRQR